MAAIRVLALTLAVLALAASPAAAQECMLAITMECGGAVSLSIANATQRPIPTEITVIPTPTPGVPAGTGDHGGGSTPGSGLPVSQLAAALALVAAAALTRIRWR